VYQTNSEALLISALLQ